MVKCERSFRVVFLFAILSCSFLDNADAETNFDVSGNGEISAFDASLILQFAVGQKDSTDYAGLTPKAANVSGNSGSVQDQITSYDAALILQFVEGKIRTLPVGDDPRLQSSFIVRTVRLGNAQELESGEFKVPVLIDNMEKVIAGHVEISFDPTELEISGALPSGLTRVGLFASKVDESTLKIAFAGSEPYSGKGEIAFIKVKSLLPGLPAPAYIWLRKVQLNEGLIPVKTELIGDRASAVPDVHRLFQNYPNPFNPLTTIYYDLPSAGMVTLSIYNTGGQKVRTLVNSYMESGSHYTGWDGLDDNKKEVASGVYYYRITAWDSWDFAKTRKMVLMR